MLAILWLIIWATVGDAFYDDYNWYTSDDGVSDQRTFDPQRIARENFTNILRNYADSYIRTREGDEGLTIAKAKSRLRMLKIFTHMGNSNDYDPSKGQVLPLQEGAPFCTMGRHTKVDCNHCTCVAGQLYMCTGMICPKPRTKPKPVTSCKEGTRRQIDSCNYCYCRKGLEICSTRDCRLQHDHLLIRSQYTCHEGSRRKVDCNRCVCLNGEEYCSKKKCSKKKPIQMKFKQYNKRKPEGRCNDGQSLKIDCMVCKCIQNHWNCSDKNCGVKKKTEKLLWPKCREGTTRIVDACNTCYCHQGREFCEKKDCDEEERLQYYRNLRYDEKQCDEGTYRKVDSCNYCLCLNGTEMCTIRPCPDNDLGRVSPVCKNGSVYQIDPCNDCTCQNGVYFCTNNPCEERFTSEADLLRRRKECDGWDVKYVNCNRCECLARRWVCTQKLCNGDVGQESATGDEGGENNYFYLEICKPGQKKRLDDCNTCFCRGGQWFCQIQECNEQVEKLKLKPDMKITNVFEQLETKHGDNAYTDTDNNIFKPPENIGEAVGSLLPKSLQIDKHNENIGLNPELLNVLVGASVVPDENGEEQAPCERGSRKKLDSCNNCYCYKGSWFCENKKCGPYIDDLPPNCRRGDKIIVNCVPCTCQKKGWKCNINKRKKNCKHVENEEPSLIEPPPQALRMTDNQPPRKCKIGERFRMDSCNYCYCNRHRELICTDNKCTVKQDVDDIDKYPLDIDERKCKIGTRFRKGECNYCYCNYDQRLVCSMNHCTRKSAYDLLDKIELRRFSPEICLPNERFRLDNCNWCYCTKDRKRICEDKYCDPSQKPDTRWPQNSPLRGCFIGSRFERGECQYCYCTFWKKVECRVKRNCRNNTETNTMTTMTKMTTRKRIINDLLDKIELRRFSPEICLPNERFRLDNCNWCYCTKDRKRICEDKYCDPSQKPDTRWPQNSPLRGCFIGSRFERGECQYCYCTFWKKVECRVKRNCRNNTETNTMTTMTKITKMTTRKRIINDLLDKRELRRFTPAPKICLPKERFRIDNCNWCYCTKDRKRICENKYCDPSQKPDTTWPPNSPVTGCFIGSRFDRGKCEYCYCTVWKKIRCRKRQGCVMDDSTTTTTKPKIKHTQRTKPRDSLNFECEVGQIQRVDDCNFCQCTYSRTWTCSDNVCPSNYDNHDLLDKRELRRFTPAPKICLPKERFRIDNCNWCYCTKDRKRICENKYCDPSQKPDTTWPPNSPVTGCFIGSRFDRGKCEYCYCTVWKKIRCRKRQGCVMDDSTTTTTKPKIKHTQRTKPRDSLNFECEVGQIQRVDDCNFCQCTYSRTWTCSDNVCPSNYDNHDLLDKIEIRRFPLAPKTCLPKERFRIDNCNWCYCTKDRKRICESKYCDPSQKPDTTWPPNSPVTGCFIGSRFDRGKCEYCYCTVWKKIECRVKDLPECGIMPKHCKNNKRQRMKLQKLRNSFNFECEVGEIQRVDDCNFCQCTYNRTWTCSDNVCPSNYDNLPTIFSEPECEVGEPVPATDPCNVCICLNSHILCTHNPCIQRQKDSVSKKEPTCVEGQLNYTDARHCNYCVCQGGQSFCTSRVCLMPGNFFPGLAGCSEGDIMNADDCTMCVCNKRGKYDCTNETNCLTTKSRDAISENLLSYIRTQNNKKHKMTQGTKQKCTPGKKYFPEDFDPNCPNECICDRHELLCTKRKCYNNWDKQTPFKWPLGRVEKKSRNINQFLKPEGCVEYQKLPSDDPCNSCMCLNGRKVCTIITCSEDNEGELGSDEARLYMSVQGSKGNKGNMEKKNNTFCEPFTFFSPDNNRFCRNCFCLHNGLALCLLNLCKYSKDIPNQNSPEELDEVCNPGETGYPTKCVTCTCSENRKWICSREELAVCQERDCDEKDEFHMGFFPYCAGCKCSVKEWFCSIQSEPCRDFSNATCPLGTFIHNPKQHCSICLCGGYEEGSHNMCFTEAKCVRQVISQLKLKQ